MKVQFAALTICVVLLTGCGACPSASPTTPASQTNDYLAPPNATNQSASAPEPSGPGTYLVGIKDATILLQVPANQEPDPETLAVLKLIGITPGSWISADIDNRKGQESAVLNLVALSTPEGKRIEYKSLPVISTASKASGLDTASYNRWVNWSNAQRSSAYAGERATVWLMSTEPTPAEFVRVDAASGSTGAGSVKAAKQAP